MIDFRPDRPRWQQVADVLRDRIQRGEYQPGQRIPGEDSLMQEFGIARGTTRKVAAALRDEGLIYTVPNLGSFVSRR